MSSLIEWPTIYGSVYFLPGIIVVVLLLLLLLLMSSRRRAKAERARLAPEPALAFEGPAQEEDEQPAPAPEAAAYPDYSQGVMTQPVSTSMQQGGVVTQHVGLYAQPVMQPSMIAAQPPAAPSLTLVPPPAPAAAPAMTAAPAAMAAPVVAASVTMAPLATAAVLDAISEPDPLFEPVKSGRRAKSKAARSTASLSVVTTVNTPSGTDPLSAAIQEILNGWGELAPEDMKRLELFRPDRLNAALMALQLPKSRSNDAKVRLTQMRQYGVDLERRAQANQAVEAAAAATVTAAAMPVGSMHTGGAPAATEVFAAAAPPVPAPEAPALAPVTPSFYDAEPGVTRPASIDDPSSLWAEPRPLWEPDPEPALEELPAPAFKEIEMEPFEAAFAAAPAQPETPAYSKPAFDDDLFWDDDPGAVSRLSVKVETAEQLLALPPTERVDMTAFLPPTELAATFRATHDLELKKAVIDTLEHIGTPASLNALGNCFEDADPDIQVYALAAADRLLGVAS